MNIYKFSICRWFLDTPYRAISRAYNASKRVRNIQRDYLCYKNFMKTSSKRSLYNLSLYIDAVLNKAASEIYWGLLEYKISNYIYRILCHPTKFYTSLKKFKSKNFETFFFDFLNFFNIFSIKKNLGYDIFSKKKKKESFLKNSGESYNELINNDSSLNQQEYKDNSFNHNKNPSSLDSLKNNQDINSLTRKIIWIEAVLDDLEILMSESWTSYTYMNYNSQNKKTSFSFSSFLPKPQNIPYESVGLVPRSITRTLSRFQKELAGQSASLVLPEFRLAKYQALASLQYLAFLIVFPLIIGFVCKIIFLEPLVENWWNTSQSQVFLGFSQEEKALRRLQQVEELLWLDVIMADSSAKQPQDLSAQIHQKTIDLVETYNQESIHTILHLFTNLISLVIIICLLIWGKKRLAILNSWIQEVFYSLSDTMKAFFILLLTDLCIGFHSPHGWEIFIQFLLEYLGFSHNKHVISCFVSTFPVILDTVFKYWIFRHLNRISPSIVVSYHTMNE